MRCAGTGGAHLQLQQHVGDAELLVQLLPQPQVRAHEVAREQDEVDQKHGGPDGGDGGGPGPHVTLQALPPGAPAVQKGEAHGVLPLGVGFVRLLPDHQACMPVAVSYNERI